MTPHEFVIERLESSHNRSAFSCGVDTLDRYLREQAGQEGRRHIANCFVALAPDSETIAGFYTLAATSIPSDALPEEERRRLPRYPRLPGALIGRLAVDRGYRQRRLGAATIIDAAQRALRSESAVYALVVNAKDETGAAFYRHHEFQSFIGEPLSLFVPLATMRKLMGP